MRYFDAEIVRILYRAKRNTTGLSDVKIDIWNEAGSKIVNAGTLTELANGLYYYDHTLAGIGNYIYNITCASQPHDVEGHIECVGNVPPYAFKKAGGGGGLIMKDDQTPRLLNKIDELQTQLNKLIKSLPESYVKKEDLSELKEIKKDMDIISQGVLKLLSTEDLSNLEYAE